jgi:hypothetical protein
MAWFEKNTQKAVIPQSKELWVVCPRCNKYFAKADWSGICPECGYHGRMKARARIALLADEGSFKELYREVSYSDHLNFKDATGTYKAKVEATIAKTGETESVVIGTAEMGKIPVMLHMGDPRYNYSHPVRLRHVMDTFPKLQVIAAHFGGYKMFETAKEQLWDTDCIFDISSAMMFMEPGEAERYINFYGAERMSYGTDYPLWDPVEEVKHFQSLNLTGAQFDQIAHKTAERILGL